MSQVGQIHMLSFEMSYGRCIKRQLSILSGWQPLEFLFGRDTKRCQKLRMFAFRQNTWDFWYWNTYPGYHQKKPHVQTIPKMWNSLGLVVFEWELSLIKVGRLWNFETVTKNKRRYELDFVNYAKLRLKVFSSKFDTDMLPGAFPHGKYMVCMLGNIV